MALSADERDTLNRLNAKLTSDQRKLHTLDLYYNGRQRVEQLGLAIPPELRQFLTIVDWCGTYVDAIEERIDLEGFRLPEATEADRDLWKVWQENDLDEESQLAHLDSLVLRCGFAAVGAGDGTPDDPEDDRDPATPLVTVESPREMTVELSPRTRRVSAAAKVYLDGTDRKATLYLPDQTIWLGRVNARWQEEDRDVHNLGVVPVVPLVNRPRTAHREGHSEMERVIPLADAAARALTNAQLATEVMAIPQRYVLGATKGDFVDKEGDVLSTWEAYFGAIWGLRDKDAKVGQFTAADLANFKTIVDHYASLVASVTGLPMRYLGQSTTNPPSAEGIRADESRLIKTCERRQRAWGGSWERVMRLVRRIIDGKWDPALAQLETIWRDPATPTRAQAADAAVKLYTTSPKPIVPLRQTRESLGYSQVQIARMEEEDVREAARDPIAELARATAAGAPPELPPPVDEGE